MLKAKVLSLFVVGQAAGLLVAGVVTLWWSMELMGLLIHLVGEEWALGAGNVVRREDGAVLLTNPGAMILWAMPFWLLGWLQIMAAITLVGLWRGRQSGNRSGVAEAAVVNSRKA